MYALSPYLKVAELPDRIVVSRAIPILKAAGWMLLGEDADVTVIRSRLSEAFERFPLLLNWLNHEPQLNRPSGQWIWT